MNPEDIPKQDYDQPVAYDTDGHPLYAHPAEATRSEAMVAAQAVHMTRPVEIDKPFVSDATKIKHDRSRQLYPNLNLSDGEYVIAVVRRHIIGLLAPLAIGAFLIAIVLSLLFNYSLVVDTLHLYGAGADSSNAILPVLLFAILVCLGMYVSYYIYTNNKFFLTNECVIELKQISLFNHREQSISLGSVEDASYEQSNMFQELIGYGSIRLSTIGDETTYRFTYVANPKQCIDTLNRAVEAFKNGRPVTSN